MKPLDAFGVGADAARMFWSVNTALVHKGLPIGSLEWFIYGGVSCFLVLFAGMMSGLTLGLMSLGLVDLEILQRSGSATEKRQAAAILPVVQKQHQLLVTLLLCNAGAMEKMAVLLAITLTQYFLHKQRLPTSSFFSWLDNYSALPIFLDKMFNPVVAIVLSVTFVLFFGEVIPQAICSRYGLAIGANLVCLVRVLMFLCFPVAYPVGKVLDCMLGHNEALFRRAQLKALVSIHSREAGKGGDLTHDETTIISGALDLTEKIAQGAMTPIESTFSLDVNSVLDWEAMGKILARGHSRVPVYVGSPKNVVGLLLVKSLLTIRPETETKVSSVSIRRLPRVPADMPLYDILNEFQKGSSHMAAVVRVKGKGRNTEKPVDSTVSATSSDLTSPLLNKTEGHAVAVDIENASKHANVSHIEDIEDAEVVGIITLEDVFEELLQEEIVDETDEFVDVHKRIRVAAAAAAASSMARLPSLRKLTGQKALKTRNDTAAHTIHHS